MAIPFFLKVGFGVGVSALILQLWVLYSDPIGIQSSSCKTASALQKAFPLPPAGVDFLTNYHKKTASFVWMQLSTALTFVYNYDEGSEIYLYVVFGHIVKNFAKTFIQSPRGFWFCTEADGSSHGYCGSGNSLPSGHLMMSIAFFLIIYFKRQSPRILRIGLIFQSFILFEVLYLGTHTLMDCTIGLTCGLIWFCLYRFWKEKRPEETSHYYFNAETGLVLFSLLLVYALERLENHVDDITHYPDEWQQNYERYCVLPAGAGLHKMKNSSAFEKTALLLGVNLGLILRHLIGVSDLNEGIQHHSPLQKVLRLLLGLGVFTYLNTGVKLFIGHFLLGGKDGNYINTDAPHAFNTYYVTLALQPVWTLALAPTLFHLLKLGTYIEEEEVTSPATVTATPVSEEDKKTQ